MVSSYDGHIAMNTNYLNLLASSLQAAYPNMQPGDGRGLILQGLINKDGGVNPPDGKWATSFVDKVLAHSGFSRGQIQVIYARYQTYHTSGTSCN